MGLYLLNISVDSADPNPEHIPEDLSFNDQESIIEIILEKVLGYEDAIKEYDDHDTEDHNKQKNIKIDLLVHVIQADKFEQSLIDERKKLYPDFEARLSKGFNKIDSPPPKI
ncbi:hypothetical protein [Winogradskyella sediminis]|uniref:hypothetical protein n=1 Tax=Winogradskyella sediminis TaxID=1382466 RepID=UPI000E381AB6|nr:hypothetical protein [Winogradskyella sediminis]REG87891.1 hypothetical protein C8N41_102737 [Winogradskyella sediminis]